MQSSVPLKTDMMPALIDEVLFSWKRWLRLVCGFDIGSYIPRSSSARSYVSLILLLLASEQSQEGAVSRSKSLLVGCLDVR